MDGGNHGGSFGKQEGNSAERNRTGADGDRGTSAPRTASMAHAIAVAPGIVHGPGKGRASGLSANGRPGDRRASGRGDRPSGIRRRRQKKVATEPATQPATQGKRRRSG